MRPAEVAALALGEGLSAERAILAVAIAGAESGFNPDAVGDEGLADATWGPSIGLWQIRSLKAQTNTGGARDGSRLRDPAFNAGSMFSISTGGTRWSPWSVWTNGAYRGRRIEAAGAVVAVKGLPWTAPVGVLRAEAMHRFAAEFASGLLRDSGVYNRRRVNHRPPPAPWSEHAWGNAWDIGCTMEAGDRLAAWLRADRAASGLVGQVLWRVEGHFDHVHVTAAPRRNPDGKRIPPAAVGQEGEDVETVKGIQRALNAAGWKGKDGKPLVVDGTWGPNTEHAFASALGGTIRRGDAVDVQLVTLDRPAMAARVTLT